MFAIIETGGKQYRVQPDDVLNVEKLKVNKGDRIDIREVLAVSEDNGNLIIGTPYVENATVEAEVIEHGKGKKIIVYKYKPKKKYRRKQGHRQPYTSIRIIGISFDESGDNRAEDLLETEAENTIASAEDSVVAETAETAQPIEDEMDAVLDDVQAATDQTEASEEVIEDNITAETDAAQETIESVSTEQAEA